MKNALYSILVMGLTAVSTAALLFVGCDSPDKLDQGGGGGVAGTVVIKLDAASGNGAAGGGGNTGQPPTGDANCGSVTSSTNRVPADVLLVLDKSTSMTYATDSDETCNGGGCTARWPALTDAVNATLSATASSISWGLKLYPNSGSCGVSNGVDVAISASAVPQIQSRISSTTPNGYTPTAQAIDAATAYLKTLNDANNKVILLATDGEPNCLPGESSGTTNVPGTVTAIQAASAAGFPVYVIGIGPSVGNLDNFAQAGGTNHYYPATSPQDLADAFADISQLVTTCTFTLSLDPDADLDNVAVYLDKNLVQKDGTNGWSFGAGNQTVVLNGSSCEKVKSGAASKVEILVGCGGTPPGTIP